MTANRVASRFDSTFRFPYVYSFYFVVAVEFHCGRGSF
jgi:hypothetical protein